MSPTPLQPLVSDWSTQAKNPTVGLGGGGKDGAVVVGGGITGGGTVVVVGVGQLFAVG